MALKAFYTMMDKEVSASDGLIEEENEVFRIERLEGKVGRMAELMMKFISAQTDRPAQAEVADRPDDEVEEEEDAEEKAAQMGMEDFLGKVTTARQRVKQDSTTAAGAGSASSSHLPNPTSAKGPPLRQKYYLLAGAKPAEIDDGLGHWMDAAVKE